MAQRRIFHNSTLSASICLLFGSRRHHFGGSMENMGLPEARNEDAVVQRNIAIFE